MGAWLRANGEAIYATRVAAPFLTRDWAYTRGKDGKPTYAIRLWRENEKQERRLVVDCAKAEQVAKVTHLATGREIEAKADGNGHLVLTVPEDLGLDAIADAFRLEKKEDAR